MTGFPKNQPENNTQEVTLTLDDASPLSDRTVIQARSIGDGYRASYVIGNPGDDAAINGLCKKRKVTFGGQVIENVLQLREVIAGT